MTTNICIVNITPEERRGRERWISGHGPEGEYKRDMLLPYST